MTTATLQRYYAAVSRLAPTLELVNTEIELDEFIAEWIQCEFEDGTPLHLVGDALSGLHHFEPSTRRKLHKSWRLYGIWRKYEVPCRAPPLTQDIALAMAGFCLQEDELVMAGLILLGFHCLLRTGELLLVRPGDFLLEATRGLVTLPSSKSGVRNNTRESVSIYRRHHIGSCPSHDPPSDPTRVLQCTLLETEVVVPFGTRSIRILSQLDLTPLGFRPYSLRRGGATFEMQSHGLMEKTLIRGRWKNSNIARLYICDGLALLPSLTMSWSAKQKVASFSAIFAAEHAATPRGKRGNKRQKA